MATLDLTGPFTLASLEITNVVAGADVTVVACFAAGTRVLTSAGEVPVEALRVGNPHSNDQRNARAHHRCEPCQLSIGNWLVTMVDATVRPAATVEGAFGVTTGTQLLANGLGRRWTLVGSSAVLRRVRRRIFIPSGFISRLAVPAGPFWMCWMTFALELAGDFDRPEREVAPGRSQPF